MSKITCSWCTYVVKTEIQSVEASSGLCIKMLVHILPLWLFYIQNGEYIAVLKIVLMNILEKLFGSDASDATVQTGCNILKVHTYIRMLYDDCV